MTRLDFRSGRLLALDHLAHGRRWFALGVLLVVFVMFGSLITVPDPIGHFIVNDKVVHLFAYATLMTWFAQLFRHDLTRLLLALGFIALGVLMEILQGLVPSRQFDFVDMLANSSGVLLAWAVSYTRIGNVLTAFEQRVTRRPSRI